MFQNLCVLISLIFGTIMILFLMNIQKQNNKRPDKSAFHSRIQFYPEKDIVIPDKPRETIELNNNKNDNVNDDDDNDGGDNSNDENKEYYLERQHEKMTKHQQMYNTNRHDRPLGHSYENFVQSFVHLHNDPYMKKKL